MDWRHRAACRSTDPEKFFPIDDSPAQTAPALAVCARCPVRAACLAWALTALPDGIAGGKTADERRELRTTSRPRVTTPA